MVLFLLVVARMAGSSASEERSAAREHALRSAGAALVGARRPRPTIEAPRVGDAVRGLVAGDVGARCAARRRRQDGTLIGCASERRHADLTAARTDRTRRLPASTTGSRLPGSRLSALLFDARCPADGRARRSR